MRKWTRIRKIGRGSECRKDTQWLRMPNTLSFRASTTLQKTATSLELHTVPRLLFCFCLFRQVFKEKDSFEFIFEIFERQVASVRYWSSVEARGLKIDWCCFYYFVRNSLVALLEALCARIFFFRFVNIFFCLFFFWVQGLLQSLSTAHINQAPVPGCRHSSCVLIVHVCLCVCASVCSCENVWVKW